MSSTTMQTMAASMTTPSLTTAPHGNNDSPIVGSMPTSKTDWLKEPSETSRKEEESNCFMPWLDCRRQLTLLCGHMHCGMQCIFITLCLFWKMEFHD
eukprot:CCRYP_018908-RA/>CCRYP_018908-RA protein AED:0.54 eAED:0.43 QI:0/-1/0/1/-1/0/1/0/96